MMKELNRNFTPDIRPVEDINYQQPVIHQLDNGIPVYQLQIGTQDIVKIEFIFNAGIWYEQKALVSWFTNKMLKEGTKNFTASQIAEKIDYYGAYLELSADKDMAYITVYTLNKYLSDILPVVEDVIFYPLFPENELFIKIQNKKQEYIVNSKKVKNLARWKFNELIFGENHPYGKFVDTDDYDAIKREDLIDFHRNNYFINDCKIIAAGNIRKDLIEILNKYFGKYTDEHKRKDQKTAPIVTSKLHMVHYKKEDALQSAIRIGKELFNKKHPDFLKLKVLNTILGGYFGSRLMTNIREDKGYTYGIGSAVVSMQHSGYFFIASEVGAEVTQNAIDEIYHEIDVLQNEKVAESELNLVKNYMLGSFLRSIDGPFALSENFKGLIEYGLDYNYLKSFVDIVKQINADEIQLLAQRYLDRNSLFELKVGS